MKCVHLDFHTSPDIQGIGEKFNKEEFAKALKEAHVDSITVFAKCHHGYTYYPSKVSTMHPHLKFNLLKEQIDACHSVGIKAPIYITMGWSKKDADEHPEWHQIDFWTKDRHSLGTIITKDTDPDEKIKECSWTTLCPIGGYREHLKAITREVCENFDISDGIFYDICLINDTCVCDSCKAGMIEMGLNPEVYEDVRKYYREKRIEFYKELNDIIHSYNKDAHIFYNGAADMNRPEYGVVQSHFELEDLPTAWGGYDLMPIRAKYFERFGKLYLGMTGKFHHSWGEFGGFKNKEALRYECADMVSIGASISVGDHLHPNGLIDKSTYAIIGHAFDYVTKIEKYSENTKAYTDVAIWMGHTDADLGASKILQIMHVEFDAIESGDDLSKYNLIILPDKVELTDEDKKALLEYTQRGGKIVCSYESGFEEIGIEKIEPSKFDVDYIECPIDEVTTPFLSYGSAYKTKCNGETLATVREPYFSRTAGHFCGHKNTPFKDEIAEYPALVKNGNVIYFAHPIFSAYNSTGNYILQKYIMRAIENIYDKMLKVDNFYSCGRVRIRKSNDKPFYALHLLYAPPVNRGNVCLLEDFPKVNGIEIEVKIPEAIKSIINPVTNEAISFKQENGVLKFTVDNLELHKLLIINY
ncbi:MAG: beta-galactosidase trimerization domain-containing protein [Clostridia bacterium]|nr:beta-galactosidase trimerization domain-containing protein [Clostridia bacterium]